MKRSRTKQRRVLAEVPPRPAVQANVATENKSSQIENNHPENTKTNAEEPSSHTKDKSKGDKGSPTSKESPSGQKSSSPDPNCSICLGRLENKSFTDSCFHTFCFVCLLEWSKVKAVCPLCKQPFKSIIHNVRSIEDYDQYHLQQPDEINANTFGAQRFRYRTTLTTERWMDVQQREQMRQQQLLQRPTQITAAFHWRRNRQNATSSFRRRVYANGMRVQDLEGERGRRVRCRDISAEFFRRNPATCHRLVPWLNRELNVLLSNHDDHVQFVLELILDLIKRFEIQSEEFFEHIQPFTGRRTEHFIHEFYSFARAPYDMVKYDRLAVYDEGTAQNPENIHTIEDSGSSAHSGSPVNSDDPDIIMLTPGESGLQTSLQDAAGPSREGDHNYIAPQSSATANNHFANINIRQGKGLSPLLNRVKNFLSSVEPTDTATAGWDSPPPSISNVWADFNSSTNMQPQPFNVSADDIPLPLDLSTMRNDGRNQAKNSQADEENSSSSPSSDTSHDSDVVFVESEKPWEERSPIVLSSGSDDEIKLVSRGGKRRSRELPQRYRHSSSSSSRSSSNSRSRSRSRQRSRSRSRRKARSRSRTRKGKRSRSRSTSRYAVPKSSREVLRPESRERSREFRGGRNCCQRHRVYNCWKCSAREDIYREGKARIEERRERREYSRHTSRSNETAYGMMHDKGRHPHEVSYGMTKRTYQMLSPTSSTDMSSRSSYRHGNTSIDSRSRSRSGSRSRKHKKHKRTRSDSIEVVYERSGSHSRRKKHKKHKHKHKHHKKHKSSKKHHRSEKHHDSSTSSTEKEANTTQDSCATSTTTATKESSDIESNPAFAKYKKHYTGHKKSSKSSTLKYFSSSASGLQEGIDSNDDGQFQEGTSASVMVDSNDVLRQIEDYVRSIPISTSLTADNNAVDKSSGLERTTHELDPVSQDEDLDNIVKELGLQTDEPKSAVENTEPGQSCSSSKPNPATEDNKSMQAMLDHVIASAEKANQEVQREESLKDHTEENMHLRFSGGETDEKGTHIRFGSSANDSLVSNMVSDGTDEANKDLTFPCEEAERVSNDDKGAKDTVGSPLQDIDGEEVDLGAEGMPKDNIGNISVNHLFQSIDNVLSDNCHVSSPEGHQKTAGNEVYKVLNPSTDAEQSQERETVPVAKDSSVSEPTQHEGSSCL